jgi:TetR/AcrR family transcriptional regulator, transcriptional repressor for nem operon
MARSGAQTRERILDAAERLILDKGLAATSVDEILSESGTSKGSFFHHFPTKNALARALVERYAERDIAFLDEIMSEAEAVSEDPAQQVLAFLRLFEEGAKDTVSQQPSCLYVSYIFDKQLFVDGTNDVIAGAFTAWRTRLAEKLEEAAKTRPPRIAVDLDALADHLSVTYEGAFMAGRATSDPSLMRRQLELVRQQVALLFGISDQ